MSNTIPVDAEFRQSPPVVNQTPLTTRSRSVLSKIETNQAATRTTSNQPIKAGLEDLENPAENQTANRAGKRKLELVTSTSKRNRTTTKSIEPTLQASEQNNVPAAQQPTASVTVTVQAYTSPPAQQSVPAASLSPATASMWCDEELPAELVQPHQSTNQSVDPSLAALQRDFTELLQKSYQLHQNAVDDEVWRDQSMNQLEALQISHESFREANRVLREENYSLRLTNNQLMTENKQLRSSQSASKSSETPSSPNLAIQVEDEGGRIALLGSQSTSDSLNHIDAESIPVSVYHSHIDRINEQHRQFGDEQKSRFETMHNAYQTNQTVNEKLIDQHKQQVEQLKRTLAEKEELIARMQSQSPTSPLTPRIITTQEPQQS